MDLRVWIRCFPQEVVPKAIWIALALLISLVFLLTAPADAWGLVAFCMIVVAGMSYFLWQKATYIKEQFQYGCLNPAVVVSVNPYQIAVYSDLSTSPNDAWPAVKVLVQPLGKVRGRRMQVGDKLATVSFYSGSSYSQSHWDDFHPIAVSCVTDDETAVRDALWRLNQCSDEDVWFDLENSLTAVPTPYTPGIYWMRDA